MFKNSPIQRKLMMMILSASGVAVLLTCTVLFTYELFSFRSDTVQRLSTLGRIIADNSTAALAFDDQAGAQEILTALSAEPHIVAACLYNYKDKLFAKYPETLSQSEMPQTPGQEGYIYDNGHLSGFTFVIVDNRRVGTLYLKSDMSAMYVRFQLYGGLVLLVILASLTVAYVFARKLQKQISQPILALADTARAVSQRKDYSVRAVKLGDDELGFLTESLNHMLSQIQERDKELRESEERFRLMVWNVQDYAIIMLDQFGAVQTWNAGAERLLGYGEKEILGQHFARFFPTESVASGEPEYKIKYVSKFGRVEYESMRIRKDGTLFKANIIMTALWKESGQLRGFCEITRSLTGHNGDGENMNKAANEVRAGKS